VFISRPERQRRALGFTLLEIMIGVSIVCLLLMIALPAYSDYKERTKVYQATTDIAALGTLVRNYYQDARVFPDSLAQVRAAGRLDPWGRPYVYLNLTDPSTRGQARKNKNLVPINSDFDLYSVGKDGASMPPLLAAKSRDDVIRANDGRYHGLASNYE
jgi:general secretion pathway protein G